MVSARGSTICIVGTLLVAFKVNEAEDVITMIGIMFDGALPFPKKLRHFKKSLVVS
jgi:hypothetical protein